MTINDISKNYLNSALVKITTGNRINSAADDASGLAIMEKMEAQINGLDQGIDNTYDMQNLIKTADGGLETINDSLIRIRELSVQAANGIYGDGERSIMQQEVNQLLDHIKSVTGSLEFNNKNLLGGGAENLHTASQADGGGMTVNIPDLKNLLSGLEGYDLTKQIDIDAIDEALSAVNVVRSELGAAYNRMDHTINSNSVTLLNQMAAKSRIADMDMAKGISDWSKERVLNDLQIYNTRMKMDQMKKGPISLLTK